MDLPTSHGQQVYKMITFTSLITGTILECYKATTSHCTSNPVPKLFNSTAESQHEQCVFPTSSPSFLPTWLRRCPTHFLKATPDHARKTIVASRALNAAVFACRGHILIRRCGRAVHVAVADCRRTEFDSEDAKVLLLAKYFIQEDLTWPRHQYLLTVGMSPARQELITSWI